MSNKSRGNRFETVFCEMLYEKDFWVHNMAMNKFGQPADVIAVKNGNAFLIDCKVCDTARGFAFSRVEDNQAYAMDSWDLAGNGVGWFAIELENQVYMVSLSTIRMCKVLGYHRLSPDGIKEVGMPFEAWVREYDKLRNR